MQTFAKFYLENAPNLVQDVGYIPLPSSEYDNESQKVVKLFKVVILRISLVAKPYYRCSTVCLFKKYE